ncbi:hypothetical protein AGMMS49974_08330 [Deltaproteobacteria bacterium]|nr:hypothetical protein AGMMS49974_08330 [Deltaproteobacteria bacterium]
MLTALMRTVLFPRIRQDVMCCGRVMKIHGITLRDIRLLTGLAALLHDLGKACGAFQQRLRENIRKRNLYRHEWIALRLFQVFVSNEDDAAWLTRLANFSEGDNNTAWFANLQKDGISASNVKPFKELPP